MTDAPVFLQLTGELQRLVDEGIFQEDLGNLAADPNELLDPETKEKLDFMIGGGNAVVKQLVGPHPLSKICEIGEIFIDLFHEGRGGITSGEDPVLDTLFSQTRDDCKKLFILTRDIQRMDVDPSKPDAIKMSMANIPIIADKLYRDFEQCRKMFLKFVSSRSSDPEFKEIESLLVGGRFDTKWEDITGRDNLPWPFEGMSKREYLQMVEDYANELGANTDTIDDMQAALDDAYDEYDNSFNERNTEDALKLHLIIDYLIKKIAERKKEAAKEAVKSRRDQDKGEGSSPKRRKEEKEDTDEDEGESPPSKEKQKEKGKQKVVDVPEPKKDDKVPEKRMVIDVPELKSYDQASRRQFDPEVFSAAAPNVTDMDVDLENLEGEGLYSLQSLLVWPIMHNIIITRDELVDDSLLQKNYKFKKYPKDTIKRELYNTYLLSKQGGTDKDLKNVCREFLTSYVDEKAKEVTTLLYILAAGDISAENSSVTKKGKFVSTTLDSDLWKSVLKVSSALSSDIKKFVDSCKTIRTILSTKTLDKKKKDNLLTLKDDVRAAADRVFAILNETPNPRSTDNSFSAVFYREFPILPNRKNEMFENTKKFLRGYFLLSTITPVNKEINIPSLHLTLGYLDKLKVSAKSLPAYMIALFAIRMVVPVILTGIGSYKLYYAISGFVDRYFNSSKELPVTNDLILFMSGESLKASEGFEERGMTMSNDYPFMSMTMDCTDKSMTTAANTITTTLAQFALQPLMSKASNSMVSSAVDLLGPEKLEIVKNVYNRIKTEGYDAVMAMGNKITSRGDVHVLNPKDYYGLFPIQIGQETFYIIRENNGEFTAYKAELLKSLKSAYFPGSKEFFLDRTRGHLVATGVNDPGYHDTAAKSISCLAKANDVCYDPLYSASDRSVAIGGATNACNAALKSYMNAALKNMKLYIGDSKVDMMPEFTKLVKWFESVDLYCKTYNVNLSNGGLLGNAPIRGPKYLEQYAARQVLIKDGGKIFKNFCDRLGIHVPDTDPKSMQGILSYYGPVIGPSFQRVMKGDIASELQYNYGGSLLTASPILEPHLDQLGLKNELQTSTNVFSHSINSIRQETLDLEGMLASVDPKHTGNQYLFIGSFSLNVSSGEVGQQRTHIFEFVRDKDKKGMFRNILNHQQTLSSVFPNAHSLGIPTESPVDTLSLTFPGHEGSFKTEVSGDNIRLGLTIDSAGRNVDFFVMQPPESSGHKLRVIPQFFPRVIETSYVEWEIINTNMKKTDTLLVFDDLKIPDPKTLNALKTLDLRESEIAPDLNNVIMPAMQEASREFLANNSGINPDFATKIREFSSRNEQLKLNSFYQIYDKHLSELKAQKLTLKNQLGNIKILCQQMSNQAATTLDKMVLEDSDQKLIQSSLADIITLNTKCAAMVKDIDAISSRMDHLVNGTKISQTLKPYPDCVKDLEDSLLAIVNLSIVERDNASVKIYDVVKYSVTGKYWLSFFKNSYTNFNSSVDKIDEFFNELNSQRIKWLYDRTPREFGDFARKIIAKYANAKTPQSLLVGGRNDVPKPRPSKSVFQTPPDKRKKGHEKKIDQKAFFETKVPSERQLRRHSQTLEGPRFEVIPNPGYNFVNKKRLMKLKKKYIDLKMHDVADALERSGDPTFLSYMRTLILGDLIPVIGDPSKTSKSRSQYAGFLSAFASFMVFVNTASAERSYDGEWQDKTGSPVPPLVSSIPSLDLLAALKACADVKKELAGYDFLGQIRDYILGKNTAPESFIMHKLDDCVKRLMIYSSGSCGSLPENMIFLQQQLKQFSADFKTVMATVEEGSRENFVKLLDMSYNSFFGTESFDALTVNGQFSKWLNNASAMAKSVISGGSELTITDGIIDFYHKYSGLHIHGDVDYVFHNSTLANTSYWENDASASSVVSFPWVAVGGVTTVALGAYAVYKIAPKIPFLRGNVSNKMAQIGLMIKNLVKGSRGYAATVSASELLLFQSVIYSIFGELMGTDVAASTQAVTWCIASGLLALLYKVISDRINPPAFGAKTYKDRTFEFLADVGASAGGTLLTTLFFGAPARALSEIFTSNWGLATLTSALHVGGKGLFYLYGSHVLTKIISPQIKFTEQLRDDNIDNLSVGLGISPDQWKIFSHPWRTFLFYGSKTALLTWLTDLFPCQENEYHMNTDADRYTGDHIPESWGLLPLIVGRDGLPFRYVAYATKNGVAGQFGTTQEIGFLDLVRVCLANPGIQETNINPFIQNYWKKPITYTIPRLVKVEATAGKLKLLGMLDHETYVPNPSEAYLKSIVSGVPSNEKIGENLGIFAGLAPQWRPLKSDEYISLVNLVLPRDVTQPEESTPLFEFINTAAQNLRETLNRTITASAIAPEDRPKVTTFGISNKSSLFTGVITSVIYRAMSILPSSVTPIAPAPAAAAPAAGGAAAAPAPPARPAPNPTTVVLSSYLLYHTADFRFQFPTYAVARGTPYREQTMITDTTITMLTQIAADVSAIDTWTHSYELIKVLLRVLHNTFNKVQYDNRATSMHRKCHTLDILFKLQQDLEWAASCCLLMMKLHEVNHDITGINPASVPGVVPSPTVPVITKGHAFSYLYKKYFVKPLSCYDPDGVSVNAARRQTISNIPDYKEKLKTAQKRQSNTYTLDVPRHLTNESEDKDATGAPLGYKTLCDRLLRLDALIRVIKANNKNASEIRMIIDVADPAGTKYFADFEDGDKLQDDQFLNFLPDGDFVLK